jgi:molybdopterin-guanine dinucleotide biosynthesis protein A
MDIGAIILSGGKSSRFGEDKGLYIYKNKPLITYSIDLCNKFANSILISSNNLEYKKFGFPVFGDVYKESGPMGGIHAGLSNSKNSINLIVSSDTPFIQEGLIDLLLKNYDNEDIVIFQTEDSKFQTLIGIFHSRIIKLIETELSLNHLKMIQFIKQTNHKIIKLDSNSEFSKSFINFNYQSDIQRYGD